MVTRFFDFDDLETYLRTDGKNFVRCTTRHLKENSLNISAQSIEPFRRSCGHKIFQKKLTD